jgi:hypothetical protein
MNDRGIRESELCRVCGGDGQIENAWGQIAKCPSCHGNGRRVEDTGFHDVTKTKPSHHLQSNRAPVVAKQIWPSTAAGDALAKEVRDATGISADLKAQITREIIEHEASHGQCTKTFVKKVRKQFRPGT